MRISQLPADPLRDPARLAAVERSRLLDSPPEEAFDRLTRLASRVLDAPVALVSVVTPERQFFKSCIGLEGHWARERETPLTHSFCQHVVHTGQQLIIDDARRHPVLETNLAIPDLGVIAYAGVPLKLSDGHVLGSFCVIDTRPRQWSRDDLEVIQELATSVITELELRQAYEDQAQTARALQEGLLPRALPRITGLDVAARYRPAGGSEIQVGGDFYEVIAHPDAAGADVLLGDVVGKGARAAALTGLVRYTARGAALAGRTPADVLGLVNRVLLEDTDLAFCSAVLARVTTTGASLWCAGHPKPYVVPADRPPYPAVAAGPLLGIDPHAAWEPEHLPLRPGDTLLLYTDGLVELRGKDPLRGGAVLETAVAQGPASSAAELVDRVEAAMLEASGDFTPRDDVAILAIRVE